MTANHALYSIAALFYLNALQSAGLIISHMRSKNHASVTDYVHLSTERLELLQLFLLHGLRGQLLGEFLHLRDGNAATLLGYDGFLRCLLEQLQHR